MTKATWAKSNTLGDIGFSTLEKSALKTIRSGPKNVDSYVKNYPPTSYNNAIATSWMKTAA